MNKRGMMGFNFIISLVMVVVAVMLIAAFWSPIQDSFDDLRHQDELNCKDTNNVCGGVGSNETCWNSTAGNEHGITCSMLNIGPPLILIFLILGAVGLIVKGGQSEPEYPRY